METMERTSNLRNPAYQETKQHTDILFAFNVYPCTIPDDFAFVPLHWHESMEIIYVKQGTGLVQVDFEACTAKSGDIFFVLPGHLHGLRNLKKQRMEYENIIFDMDFLGNDRIDLCSQKYLQPILNGTMPFPSCIRTKDSCYPAASACLAALDRLCSLRPAGYELGVKGHLMVLFSILIQKTLEEDGHPEGSSLDLPGTGQKRPADVSKLKTVLLRIEKDYAQKLTVQDMADECGYSTSHFMRWFRDVTGTAFHKYLIEYRLSKAALALRDTDDTILDIAGKNGFDNLSNFNRLFKKNWGMTPRQFRNSSIP